MASLARLSTAARTAHYGPPCQGPWATAGVWGLSVRVHWRIYSEFVNACIESHQRGCRPPKRIDSYNCRRIRGLPDWSLHAWPLAFDMFNTPPGVAPPGGVWTPDDPIDPILVDTFERRGWTWGGRFRRRDTPHFEWAGLPPANP